MGRFSGSLTVVTYPFGLFSSRYDRVAARSLKQLSIDAHVIDVGIGLAAEFGDHGAVDLHVPGRDQLLGFSPGGNARRGDDFL